MDTTGNTAEPSHEADRTRPTGIGRSWKRALIACAEMAVLLFAAGLMASTWPWAYLVAAVGFAATLGFLYEVAKRDTTDLRARGSESS